MNSSSNTSNKRNSLGRNFFLIILLAMLATLVINVYVFSFGSRYILSKNPENPENPEEIKSPFDAKDGSVSVAIVLGASVYSNGTLSPMLEERAKTGLDLYRRGLVKKILVSGDNQRLSYNEVIPIRAYLLAKGVPPEDIFTDFAGFSTYDTMYRARNIFGAENVIVVTQSFHLPRSIFTARKLGLNAYGVPANQKGYDIKNNTREIGATVKTFINVVTKAKPRFLGAQIPINGDGQVSLPESLQPQAQMTPEQGPVQGQGQVMVPPGEVPREVPGEVPKEN